ncbi:MAG TPA: nucleoside triphosphate pyrophosphohydrolase [Steroidobacteraceae bacterium]|nr:nucleoside triphosphate pyrophosphohydrolase [Steroidobacteraceae bacterium]
MSSLDRLLQIMTRLRDPQHGCPWDREQDWASIAPHTIEEAYELADAIARTDPDAVRDELGDVLFQVVFQARIAQERGLFDFEDVARTIADKLERRHPHVFGDARIESAAAQTQAWEEHKRAERAAKGQGTGALDGVTLGLPALTRAGKLGSRAAKVGFDWPDAGAVLDKVDEEIAELRHELAAGTAAGTREELGDLLFALTQAARHLGVDPEGALRDANAKFERRFRHVEAMLAREGLAASDVDMNHLEALWGVAKREIG